MLLCSAATNNVAAVQNGMCGFPASCLCFSDDVHDLPKNVHRKGAADGGRSAMMIKPTRKDSGWRNRCVALFAAFNHHLNYAKILWLDQRGLRCCDAAPQPMIGNNLTRFWVTLRRRMQRQRKRRKPRGVGKMMPAGNQDSPLVLPRGAMFSLRFGSAALREQSP